MIPASLPPNENERLAALAKYAILDSPTESAFDEIANLVASVCQTPICLVSLVDGDRQWFKSAIGLDTRQTPRDASFCAHAILQPERLLNVADASSDARFAQNPLVTGSPNIRFYAGTPLVTADGHALGTLCVIDTKARGMTPQQEDALRVGGRAIMLLLEQRRAMAELRAATRAQNSVEAQLRAEIATRRQIEEQLSFSSSHDGLTQLANRSKFIAELKTALNRFRATESHRFAVYFIDLDRFKQVNDTLGHCVGDALLLEVGRRLNDIVRPQDTVARLGGDEFTVLINGVTSDAMAGALVDRIAAALGAKLQIGETELSITASIGVCLVDDSYTSFEEILRDSDIAMYASKDRGRNRSTLFTRSLREEFAFANEMHVTLRAALDHGQFRLSYQPIIALQSPHERPLGFEALLRLKQADGTLQSAAQFIDTAEQTGLIVELGEWVLREACAQARRWQIDCTDPVVTAVNVSAKQLAEPDFAATVKAAISEAGLDPRLLALEVTESILIADVDASLAILNELHDFGVKIYLDDFGTGYSSLSYLRKFPVDRIKIDRSFVSGAADDLVDPVIVNSIISLAHKLNVEVVAEGVETETQRAALEAMDCDWVQGFLFSPAVPAAAASMLLRRWSAERRTAAA